MWTSKCQNKPERRGGGGGVEGELSELELTLLKLGLAWFSRQSGATGIRADYVTKKQDLKL